VRWLLWKLGLTKYQLPYAITVVRKPQGRGQGFTLTQDLKMPKGIQEVKLKDGRELSYLKQGDRHVFFDNVVAMSRVQLYVLIFIVITVILITVVEFLFITEGFNRTYRQLQVMDNKLNLLIGGNVTMYSSIGNEGYQCV